MNKNFNLCEKYKVDKNINPILFFHVPKSAGTTLSVALSWLFESQTRIPGPLFINNDKGGKTAYELFRECSSYEIYNKFNFIYGHLPYEVTDRLNKKFFKISLLRNPIERVFSHYNWMINRGYCNKYDDLQYLFEENKISKNTITNQFSGIGYENKNNDQSLSLAYENLSNNIDLLYKSSDIFYLITDIISLYDLPNVLMQNQQESNYEKTIREDDLSNIIKNNNGMDIELYKELEKNKIFSNITKIKYTKKNNSHFLFSSPEIKINEKNNIILKSKEFMNVTKKLLDNNFKIKNF